MKIFVTGGTGFIGSYVAKALLDDGHELTLLARNPRKVAAFEADERIRFVEGSMEDYAAIARGLEGQDACIHVALSWLGGTAEENAVRETLPTIRLFQAAAEAGVMKLLFTSSIASFGTARHDDTGYIRPMNYYGAAKAASEAYLMAIAYEYGLQANAIRPGYTFGNPCVKGGPLYPDLKLMDMVKKARANEPMTFVKNDGTQFIWAGDLAKVYMALLHADIREHNRGYFTAVSTEHRTWAQIAQMAVDLLGSRSEITLIDKGRPAPDGTPIDVSRIRDSFGFSFTADERMKEHLLYLSTLEP
ncbi:NAD-dependent epimerase/dehydratase family protein [Cohnella sp. JJ-181]|uniref:NAD-dependent epimerase/dehydratase family protein n=1 Tax=Cohnella rhizoplanae TaxID=2974897 RepID=UPI0022FFAB6E|nr:NAD(P)-dependent oxidoreductase [Cohnella sp. JJ-181]CAI6085727.1 ADP-L-glycero-D-manno-heptose-6-epimerase [Cohnella sp. JJ-181]